jgi:hypothetical protein
VSHLHRTPAYVPPSGRCETSRATICDSTTRSLSSGQMGTSLGFPQAHPKSQDSAPAQVVHQGGAEETQQGGSRGGDRVQNEVVDPDIVLT